jgi:hypothetical protein
MESSRVNTHGGAKSCRSSRRSSRRGEANAGMAWRRGNRRLVARDCPEYAAKCEWKLKIWTGAGLRRGRVSGWFLLTLARLTH